MAREDRLVSGPDRVLFEWLSVRTDLIWSDDFRGVGRVIQGKLVAVVGYNNHTGSSCHYHLAGEGPMWMNRDFLRMAFEVPFHQWRYNVLIAPIASGNARSLNLALRLGFSKFGIINGGHPDGSLVIHTMRREDCRWVHNGQG